MASISTCTQVHVKQCSLCQGDTEYHCRTCGQNLCPLCKRTHTIRLDTKDHNVTLYREKFSSFYKIDSIKCLIHPEQINEMYCKSCDLLVCSLCNGHTQHQLQNVRTAYKNKREQNQQDVINIRSEIIYNACVLYAGIKSDVTVCQTKMLPAQSNAMLTKSQKLKDSIDTLLSKFFHNITVEFKSLLDHLLSKQRTKMKRYISSVRDFEHIYEYSAYRPVQFLKLIKQSSLPHIQDTPHLKQRCLLSLSQEIHTKELINLLSEIKINEGRRRTAKNEILLKMMPCPVLQKSLRVPSVIRCLHISCVTTKEIWVSDFNNVVLIDTTKGNLLHRVKDSCYLVSGIHAVNSACELLYIDKDYNIKKLCNDRKTITKFINHTDTDSKSSPQCKYCSPTTGDLLVGMFKRDADTDIHTGKVMRFDNTGGHTQTIPKDRSPHELYKRPLYITENNNGDIVVSDIDLGAVVVTSCKGSHRFSYTGLPLVSGLLPQGVCTDAMSHILVCDDNTETIHVIDKDGVFLSYLLTNQSPGIDGKTPYSLSYDFNNHRLWVGVWSQNVASVYRYIERHLDLNNGTQTCEKDASNGRRSHCQKTPENLQDNDETSTARSNERYASEVVEIDVEKAEEFSLEVTTTGAPTRAELRTIANEAKTKITAQGALIANRLAALKETVRAAQHVSDTSAIIVAELVPEGPDILEEILNNDGDDNDNNDTDFDVDEDNIEILYRR